MSDVVDKLADCVLGETAKDETRNTPPPSPVTPQVISNNVIKLDIDFRAGDVLVATYPRSGTTWTIEIIRQLHLRHITDTDHYLWQKKRALYLKETLRETKGPRKITNEFLKGFKSPRIFKTHDNYSDIVGGYLSNKQCKIVHVIRDPVDVFCSIYEQHRRLDSPWRCKTLNEAVARMKEGERERGRGPGDWWEVTGEYLNNTHNKHILYLQFEQLKHHTGPTIQKINNFLGYPDLSQSEIDEVQEATGIEKMVKTHLSLKYSVYAGAAGTGSYRENIAAPLLQEIKDKTSRFVKSWYEDKMLEDKDVDLEVYT